jgi:hypothetical protein
MIQIDPKRCKIGCGLGWGYNHCFHGNVFCINDSIKAFSKVITMGNEVVTVNSGKPM